MTTGYETLDLCLALKEVGYNPKAATDPIAWNDKLNALPKEEQDKGWFWYENPKYGWYPNLGRRAMVEDLKHILGEEKFIAKYGEDNPILHGSQSHEQWLVDLTNAVKETGNKESAAPIQ